MRHFSFFPQQIRLEENAAAAHCSKSKAMTSPSSPEKIYFPLRAIWTGEVKAFFYCRTCVAKKGERSITATDIKREPRLSLSPWSPRTERHFLQQARGKGAFWGTYGRRVHAKNPFCAADLTDLFPLLLLFGWPCLFCLLFPAVPSFFFLGWKRRFSFFFPIAADAAAAITAAFCPRCLQISSLCVCMAFSTKAKADLGKAKGRHATTLLAMIAGGQSQSLLSETSYNILGRFALAKYRSRKEASA